MYVALHWSRSRTHACMHVQRVLLLLLGVFPFVRLLACIDSLLTGDWSLRSVEQLDIVSVPAVVWCGYYDRSGWPLPVMHAIATAFLGSGFVADDDH